METHREWTDCPACSQIFMDSTRVHCAPNRRNDFLLHCSESNSHLPLILVKNSKMQQISTALLSFSYNRDLLIRFGSEKLAKLISISTYRRKMSKGWIALFLKLPGEANTRTRSTSGFHLGICIRRCTTAVFNFSPTNPRKDECLISPWASQSSSPLKPSVFGELLIVQHS